MTSNLKWRTGRKHTKNRKTKKTNFVKENVDNVEMYNDHAEIMRTIKIRIKII